ncbi:unnamed protein product [Meloidogyne enterolobii]|uniref:Uncharacterized protein n=1 Tax=Meloidogyne enterolobii TaxID=390850 RepID=A0ACB1AKI5_MELEN
MWLFMAQLLGQHSFEELLENVLQFVILVLLLASKVLVIMVVNT